MEKTETFSGFRLADFVQEVAEEVAVFGAGGWCLGGVPRSRTLWRSSTPGVGEGHGQVQAGLSAQGGQQAVGALPGDDSFEDFDGERLDVDVVGDAVVGHNRGRVGVDQHGLDALFAEGLAGLRAGVVELGGLTYDDWPGTYNQNFSRLIRGSASIYLPIFSLLSYF